MGFKREIGRTALCLALLACTVVAHSKPAEPLVITPLGEPELQVVAMDGSSETASLDERITAFSKLIGQATTADARALRAKCRLAARASGSASARMAWETSCGYLRR
jgi:hypothetical protein